MIELLFFSPIALCAIAFVFKTKVINIIVQLLYSALLVAASIIMYVHPASFTAYFSTNDLNIYFIFVIAILSAGTSVHNIRFILNDSEDNFRQTLYTICMLLFTASITGIVLTAHLALFWVFVEGTTLSSAFLIYYYRKETSIEAAWKYLFICSIGIALAFIGITLLSMGIGSINSFFFNDLENNAKNINSFWLKLSFPFMLIGFGTKVGFAPVHAWLPDAYSEAPAPVAAMLSAALEISALLGIIKINRIMHLAGLGSYSTKLLFITGFLSLLVAAIYMRIVKDYKRLLAYSSVENMGIIAIGIATGGIGLFAAMFHIISHSLTKGSLFLTSGSILHRYGTKDITSVRGLIKGDPASGWIWIFTLIAITGLPPFPMFLSEFFIIKGLFHNNQYVPAFIFMLLLTVIMAALFRNMLIMSFGEDTAPPGAKKTSLIESLPQIAFLVILVICGIMLPDKIHNIIQKAAAML